MCLAPYWRWRPVWIRAGVPPPGRFFNFSLFREKRSFLLTLDASNVNLHSVDIRGDASLLQVQKNLIPLRRTLFALATQPSLSICFKQFLAPARIPHENPWMKIKRVLKSTLQVFAWVASFAWSIVGRSGLGLLNEWIGLELQNNYPRELLFCRLLVATAKVEIPNDLCPVSADQNIHGEVSTGWVRPIAISEVRSQSDGQKMRSRWIQAYSGVFPPLSTPLFTQNSAEAPFFRYIR